MLSKIFRFKLIFKLLISINFLEGAIFNADPRYGKWLRLHHLDSVTRIPVYIDASKYDFNSLSTIQQAIAQMNSDLYSCIQFFQVPSPLSATRDFIYISTLNNDGTPGTTCASFPGRLLSQNRKGQKLLLIGGSAPGACLGSVREVMRFLFLVLGLRNEFRRPDRLITINQANINPTMPVGMYSVYELNKIALFTQRPGFDFNSITMISPTANSSPLGSVTYSSPAGISVGTLPRISATDCAAVAVKYHCTGYCADPYQQNGGVFNVIPGVATTALPTTTTPATTTATLPLPDY